MRGRLAILFCIALLAGCGESEDEQFRDDFDAINDLLADLGQEIADALEAARSKSDEELGAQFEGFAEDIADMRGEVEELDPPDDLSDELDRLETTMNEVKGSLEDISVASEDGDPEAARAATRRLIEQGERLDALQRELLDAR